MNGNWDCVGSTTLSDNSACQADDTKQDKHCTLRSNKADEDWLEASSLERGRWHLRQRQRQRLGFEARSLWKSEPAPNFKFFSCLQAERQSFARASKSMDSGVAYFI